MDQKPTPDDEKESAETARRVEAAIDSGIVARRKRRPRKAPESVRDLRHC